MPTRTPSQTPSPQYTPDELFQALGAPDGDFEIRNRFESKRYPLWCSDCEDWHVVHYDIDIGRFKGNRFIDVWFGGANEGPELAERWTDNDGLEKYAELMDRYFGKTFQTLVSRSFAGYYDWVLTNGKDPLGICGPSERDVVISFMAAANNANLTQRALVN